MCRIGWKIFLIGRIALALRLPLHIAVSVCGIFAGKHFQYRVSNLKRILKFMSCNVLPASQTLDRMQIAVQVGDVVYAGKSVQAIHVLCDQCR